MPEPKPEALAAWNRAIDASTKLLDSLEALQDHGADGATPFRASVRDRPLAVLAAAHAALGEPLVKLEAGPTSPRPRPRVAPPASSRPHSEASSATPGPPLRARMPTGPPRR